MSPSFEHPIEVTPEGGGATVVIEPNCVYVNFHVDSGHLPACTRSHLVDSVFSLSQLGSGRMLHASVPVGDVELLDALRDKCTDMTVHTAGATCLVEGILA